MLVLVDKSRFWWWCSLKTREFTKLGLFSLHEPFLLFSCLSAAFVLHVFMEKYLVKRIPLRAENAPSCGSAAVGWEVNGIPVPQASFHLESLGFSPLISLVAEQLLHSCCFSGALEKLKSGSNMASQQLGLRLLFLVVVAMLTLLTGKLSVHIPSSLLLSCFVVCSHVYLKLLQSASLEIFAEISVSKKSEINFFSLL